MVEFLTRCILIRSQMAVSWKTYFSEFYHHQSQFFDPEESPSGIMIVRSPVHFSIYNKNGSLS